MVKETYPARVLVTGAAGFIGSHVVDRLLADGCAVWGLDNFDPFYERAIKESNLEAARANARFEFREGDLRDAAFLEELLGEAQPGAVVHLAARAGVRPSIEEPEAYYEINVMGTVRLLDAMRRSGIRTLVFASSSSIYGAITENRPFSEEDVTDKPISPYAATKRAGELLCHSYHQLHGLSCSSLRFFTVYGPRQRPDLAIHKFTRAVARGEAISIYGDGGALRDYTYVEDTVDGVCRSLRRICDPSVGPVFEVFNLGAGRMVSVNALVTLLAKAMGVEPQIERVAAQPGDVPRTWADITKARQTLGYEPRVSIEEGLARFVSWYREVYGIA
ncbi:MAG: SDR family NAD(P)-dependent oxidoreductase [Gemmatimonadota bacterium]|nr:MAG: SDR family NAD(P)-dependent oxidoreductase [Gemmatimonadota bacterium]